jgi:hypothetical protein
MLSLSSFTTFRVIEIIFISGSRLGAFVTLDLLDIYRGMGWVSTALLFDKV